MSDIYADIGIFKQCTSFNKEPDTPQTQDDIAAENDESEGTLRVFKGRHIQMMGLGKFLTL